MGLQSVAVGLRPITARTPTLGVGLRVVAAGLRPVAAGLRPITMGLRPSNHHCGVVTSYCGAETHLGGATGRHCGAETHDCRVAAVTVGLSGTGRRRGLHTSVGKRMTSIFQR